MRNKIFSLVNLLIALFFADASYADYPRPWQMDFQAPVTSIMHKYLSFQHFLHIICVIICLLVLFLLTYVCIRFHKSNNPTPSKTSHNSFIEIIWTLIPVVILIGVSIPSLRILYYSNVVKSADMTLKIVGHQWYWEYQYPDHGNFSFDSYMISDDKLQKGQLRLLEVDNRVILPVNTNIRILTTSQDVIHSWAVPSFGIKTDAVPGRINEAWFNVERPGIYYGQCSELCGVGHAFMPIAVEVVSKEDFEKWISEAKQKYANLPVQYVSLK
ncbi:MAG: cytochrome c oxidase subunit II [Alphaproteobacteria bacterium]